MGTPAAVLAIVLHQSLEKDDPRRRKVLSFSDSGQDATFFAPYLEFTYDRILFRRLIAEAIERNKPLEDYHLRSLCDDVVRLAGEKGVLDDSMDNKEKKKEIRKWIFQVFRGTWDRRKSVEGVGLLSFMPITPENWKPIG